ncbi:Ig-like domain-containing protein [Pseudomonas frederiksbergensis]|uniref:Bacterial Ig-like domain-containing protein n=1 Tax=Pseudomonas frederiksbergensis TaxID=104087 RepID=A0A423KDE0_9PSED|nr:Ig-like domain-containing protein [Pseudomonas frederiksbergensis]RON50393.1 hypothetical protein BK665_21675 [Pseudomonas frederiksbergensis]
MDTEQPNAEILVNYPPQILGATPSVIPYTPVPQNEPVVGAPLALFTPVLNRLGVLANAVKVLIDPPGRDGSGDDYISIELLLNDISLESRPIPIADRDQRTEFTLFESLLNDGINNKLEYKVHRPSGNAGDSTPLWILYSVQLPGGNIVPGDNEHPYLDISLPPELGNPPVIGKDEVDKGVPLTLFYPYMKAYDVITVRLQNSDFPLPPLLPEEVGKPKVVTVIREVLEGIGSNSEFQFSYTVVDQLRNPTQRRRWSKILKADVDVDRIVDTTITSVKGSPSNVDIPNGGITVETTVILSGTAGKGQKVQVLDDGTLKGEPIADRTTGVWTLTVSGLTLAAHRFTARVGAGTASAARTLTVTAVIVPTLTSVKGSPSNAEILENGITVETSLILTGTASKGGTATANATSGVWQLTIAVAVGAHRLYAKSRYHPTPVFSNVRNLTVTAVIVPTLTSVKGSPSGVEILENGITVETSLILTGTASKGLRRQRSVQGNGNGQRHHRRLAIDHRCCGRRSPFVRKIGVSPYSGLFKRAPFDGDGGRCPDHCFGSRLQRRARQTWYNVRHQHHPYRPSQWWLDCAAVQRRHANWTGG